MDKNRSKQALTSVSTQFDDKIEKILDRRVMGTSKKNTNKKFLIHRKGKSAVDENWEKENDFWNFYAQINEYLKTVSIRTTSSNFAGGLLDP